ncbi:hypothetical protein MJO28_015787 [Puccinia striiformis f. sp. tritici]|uniref:Uncharacterized protein n=3 Tax=Puccinia striiformis TaxID=27350 RepID=A0A0L0V504_9BASI|nr:hypothetical protein Pst134EA_029244 [Puccinia striiformis f. sp. tritici]KAI9614192.1 hypothetical protein H4Q26_009333 [Puccinia striiformis f. sp. tritici PST-130]KNE94281.1 hypothetical protein PSTG_12307 [Puccinia striiformis f. sp. tritici PST-78]POW09541.1 hypothetical protein PSTT_06771 [Puccinia striiformis]KAH9447207.1 hypothetical protein Pst134EA_029244 [Puccinia striiformis f. sp. tritici]KAI7936888.1 hypothetical protein MJO28_015787 [Puccinia striiformis f. sp. tritici]
MTQLEKNDSAFEKQPTTPENEMDIVDVQTPGPRRRSQTFARLTTDSQGRPIILSDLVNLADVFEEVKDPAGAQGQQGRVTEATESLDSRVIASSRVNVIHEPAPRHAHADTNGFQRRHTRKQSVSVVDFRLMPPPPVPVRQPPRINNPNPDRKPFNTSDCDMHPKPPFK